MFFARPYRKAILAVLKDHPLFKERWFFVNKVKDALLFDYNAFNTSISAATGGGLSFIYNKSGSFSAELSFPFLSGCAAFDRLTHILDVIPDDGLDAIDVYEEKEGLPQPQSVAVITIEGVTKETVKAAARRLSEAVEDIIQAYAGEDEE